MPKEPCIQLSHIFSKLFNSEQYSDMKVVFPRSNHTLHLHQIVICESSEFFKLCLSHEMKELNEGAVVTMGDDDDEELMTELLKACYHFEIEMPSDKSRIVPLVQLAQKYQFHSLLPALVSHLTNNIDVQSNVLQCLSLDLDSDDAHLKSFKEKLMLILQNSSVDILRSNLYLTLDFRSWCNALQLMVNCENHIIANDAVHSWISFDGDNRSLYSLDLLQIVKSASTVRTYAFDPAYCGTRATLLNHNRRIKKKGGSYEWNCAAMGVTQCNEFSIRLIRNCSQLMIGMAPKYNSERPFNKEGNNFRTCGWYLWCNVGSLFSQNGDDNKKYLAQCYYRGFGQQQVVQDKGYDMEGTVIGVKLSNTGELSFSVNGEDMGVAFTGLPNSGLYPAFDLNKDCEFEFV